MLQAGQSAGDQLSSPFHVSIKHSQLSFKWTIGIVHSDDDDDDDNNDNDDYKSGSCDSLQL